MNFKSFAKEIVEGVGGKENIRFATHCSTRLRLELVDEKKVNITKIEALDKVVGTTYKSNQFQIIIGAEVNDVYQEVLKLIETNKNQKDKKKVKFGTYLLDVITGSITPTIPLICGSGLIAAFLALFVSFGWIDQTSQTYNILNTFGNVGLYALPIYLGFSIAKKIDTNPYYGALIGALMLHPNIAALSSQGIESISYFGLPMLVVNYGSSMVPIFFAVFFLKYVDKFLTRLIPEIVRIFIQPMFVLFIVGSITLLAFGPIGIIIGNFLTDILLTINNHASWLAVGLIGALLPWLTITGMHLSLMPVAFIGISSIGYDALLFPAAFVHNMAEAGAGLAVALKTKNKKLKSLALSNTLTVILGISEPILYTVHMKLKRTLFAVTAGGAVGGIFMGIMGVKAIAPGASILTLGAFVGDTFIWACVGAIIAFIAAFIASFIIGFKDDEFSEETDEEFSIRKNLLAPINGKVVPLSSLSDEAFLKMGKGIAILPSDGKLYAPLSGRVEMLYPTSHAIGIRTDSGIELLMHIGIDTVNLNGEGFRACVKCNDYVNKGELLIEFDNELLKEKGYDTSVVVLVTSNNYHDLFETDKKEVKVGDELLTII